MASSPTSRPSVETDDPGERDRLEQPAVVADQQERAVEAGDRLLELLDGRQVEVVGRLVEDEAVDALGHQQGEDGPGPLARRERARRSSDVARRRGRTWPAGCGPPPGVMPVADSTASSSVRAPSSRRRACSTSPTTTPGPSRCRPAASSTRPRSASSSVVLPLPLRAHDADPLGPADRPGRSGPRAKSPRSTTAPSSDGHQLPAALALADVEAQVPRLPRLVDHLQPGQGLLRPAGLGRQVLAGLHAEVADVLVVVVGRPLAPGCSPRRPLTLPLGSAHQSVLRWAVYVGVGLLRVAAGGGLLLLVGEPAAAERAAPGGCARRARSRR